MKLFFKCSSNMRILCFWLHSSSCFTWFDNRKCIYMCRRILSPLCNWFCNQNHLQHCRSLRVLNQDQENVLPLVWRKLIGHWWKLQIRFFLFEFPLRQFRCVLIYRSYFLVPQTWNKELLALDSFIYYTVLFKIKATTTLYSTQKPIGISGCKSELQRIVNMDRIPNTEYIRYWKFNEYQIPNNSLF